MLFEDALGACSMPHNAFQGDGEPLHNFFHHFLAACLPDLTGFQAQSFQPIRLFGCIAEDMYLAVPGFVPCGKLYALDDTDSVTFA